MARFKVSNPTPLSDRVFYMLVAIVGVWALLTPTGKQLVRSFWEAVGYGSNRT